MSDNSPTTLCHRLETAMAARHPWLASWHAEQTQAYRLFHGSTEGEGGLTVDRYGEALLIQSFHRSLTAAQQQALGEFYAGHFPGLPQFYNDRSQSNSRIANPLPEALIAVAHQPLPFQELGVNYQFQARHAGQDPWLFLDMRAGRRRLMQEIAGKSLLNLFAYTCGVGVAAAVAGARHVVNVDFSETSLAQGREHARINALPIRLRFVKCDAFAALRQYSGQGQAQTVRGKRMPPFPTLEPHQFDVVFLDPPRYAKSPFGVVDLVNDYAALFKPALLCTAEGGTLFCCNNVAAVGRDAWLDQLERSARKIGRPIRAAEWLAPEADFPSPDGQSPLKMLLLRV